LLFRQFKDLREQAQATPNMTVYVNASTLDVYINGTRLSFAGGNSPAFSAPVGNPRIDLVTLDDAGVLAITQGTAAAVPAEPMFPRAKMANQLVYLRPGCTSITAYDDGNAAHGYLYRDVRPFVAADALSQATTVRTRMFESGGNYYWAVNAEYDAVAAQWNRIDVGEYAYLIGIYSETGIPHEPGDLGGIVWWRCTPGANPIADYTAVGGWELGYMMTEHRNFVMGGMNVELDGSGSPPFGRFSESGREDADAFTGLLRNVWYNGNLTPGTPGTGTWGPDSATYPSYGYFTLDNAGWAWKRVAAGSGTFNTSDWVTLATLNDSGDLWLKGGLDVDGTATVGSLAGYIKGTAGALSGQTGVPWGDVTSAPSFYQPGGTDVAVADGGTNKSSWTQYSIPYASETTTLSAITIGTALQLLQVNAGANGYQWTGALTNPMTTLGDIIYGGASPAGTPTRLAGAAGWLKSTGAAAPAWTAIAQADVSGLTTASSPTFATALLSTSTAGAQTLLTLRNPSDGASATEGLVWQQGSGPTHAGSIVSGYNGSVFYQKFNVGSGTTNYMTAIATLLTLNVPLERGANAITGSGALGASGTYIGSAYITAMNMNAGSIVTDTTTGLEIGTGATQKLGFWGAAPIVQGAAITSPAASASPSEDGACRTAVRSLLVELRAAGIIAN